MQGQGHCLGRADENDYLFAAWANLLAQLH